MKGNRTGSILALAAATALVLLMAERAAAWSEGGHRVVANVAYSHLKPNVRAKVVAVLKKHPRFEEDFLDNMPDDVADDTKTVQARWLFSQAGVWPDIARDLPEFHNKNWHFINEPFYLDATAKQALQNLPEIVPDKKLPDDVIGDPKELNAVQALKLCIKRLQDPTTGQKKKAVYLCWLIHLVGDVHQPLHSTSLYSKGRFNKKGGDHGGNSIPTKQGGNLHSYWDGLMGKKINFNNVQKRTQEIFDEEELTKAGEDAAKSLTIEDWIGESFQLCKDVVYAKIILDEVADKDAVPAQKLAKIDLPQEYLTKAGQVAQKRVAEAGYRLSEIVKQCFP